MIERCRSRQADPSDPRNANLNSEISRETDQNKRNIRRDKGESCSVRHATGKYFKLLRDLSGTNKPQDLNQPISFEGLVLTDDKKIAPTSQNFLQNPYHTSQIAVHIDCCDAFAGSTG